MSERLARAWGGGCLRSLVIQAAVGLVLVAAAGLCAVTAAVVPLPRAYANDREWLFVGGLVVLVLGALAATLIWAVWQVRTRAHRLDGVLAPLGLTGRRYLTGGRQYRGRVGGREVYLYFHRGPTLEIYLDSSVRARLTATPRTQLGRALSGLVGRQPLALDDLGLEQVSVHAEDEGWARRTLSDGGGRQALTNLLTPIGSAELRQVAVQPGAVYLLARYLPLAALTAENTQRWLAELARLAEAAEAQPAPTSVTPASWLEQKSRADRDAFWLPAIAAIGGVLLAVSVLFACIIVAVLALEAR